MSFETKLGFAGTAAAAAIFVLGTMASAAPARAQERGPIKPPPTTSTAPPATTSDAAPPPATKPNATSQSSSAAPAGSTAVTNDNIADAHAREAATIRNVQPSIPVDQIVKGFGEHEKDFKLERDNYTYTQSVLVETLDVDGRPDGEYRMTSDIVFTPEGKRYEKVTYAPQSTLERIQLTPEDMSDLEHVQPFVLTSDDLPKYDVNYVGQQRLDELDTYVFDVAPKKIEKGQRYFQGRIWVDQKDLAIVKTYGKAVPDIKDNKFPRFETYRENIEKNYWFPTLTRADDVLHFQAEDIPIRMVVRYSNYKRFGVKVQIKADPNHP
jgi:hypothetical protein